MLTLNAAWRKKKRSFILLGWLISLIHNTRRQCNGLDEFQISAFSIREQTLATAEHQRVNMQANLIHQIILEQGMDQNAASIHDDVFARLPLQLANFLDRIATDKI